MPAQLTALWLRRRRDGRCCSARSSGVGPCPLRCRLLGCSRGRRRRRNRRGRLQLYRDGRCRRWLSTLCRQRLLLHYRRGGSRDLHSDDSRNCNDRYGHGCNGIAACGHCHGGGDQFRLCSGSGCGRGSRPSQRRLHENATRPCPAHPSRSQVAPVAKLRRPNTPVPPRSQPPCPS